MSSNAFVMQKQRQGELKYLLLTITPPLLAMLLLRWLADTGILPGGETARLIYLSLSMAGMLILGYPLILKKNHSIEVKDNLIIEYDWRQCEVSRIKAAQIHSIKRNILNEIILLDGAGNRLLCIERNMCNFSQFENWLRLHNIR